MTMVDNDYLPEVFELNRCDNPACGVIFDPSEGLYDEMLDIDLCIDCTNQVGLAYCARCGRTCYTANLDPYDNCPTCVAQLKEAPHD